MVCSLRLCSAFAPALLLSLSLIGCSDSTGGVTGDTASEASTGTPTGSSSATTAGPGTSDGSGSSSGANTTSGPGSTGAMTTALTMNATTTSTNTNSDSDSDSDSGVGCSYPDGAVEPMALDEVIYPYGWPEAIRADGTTFPLQLLNAPCADDPLIDWSIHDLLVFVSIPAW